jgi:hypothetical protein
MYKWVNFHWFLCLNNNSFENWFNRTAQIFKLFNFVECDIKKFQSHNEFVGIFNSIIFCLKKNIRKLFNLFNDLMGRKKIRNKIKE